MLESIARTFWLPLANQRKYIINTISQSNKTTAGGGIKGFSIFMSLQIYNLRWKCKLQMIVLHIQ